ncbi:MAG: hypothetical protein WC875_02365 [Candidatus Absconditabacterales bacterium]
MQVVGANISVQKAVAITKPAQKEVKAGNEKNIGHQRNLLDCPDGDLIFLLLFSSRKKVRTAGGKAFSQSGGTKGKRKYKKIKHLDDGAKRKPKQ